MWLQKSRGAKSLDQSGEMHSGVNSQAAARLITATSRRVCLLCVPGVDCISSMCRPAVNVGSLNNDVETIIAEKKGEEYPHRLL